MQSGHNLFRYFTSIFQIVHNVRITLSVDKFTTQHKHLRQEYICTTIESHSSIPWEKSGSLLCSFLSNHFMATFSRRLSDHTDYRFLIIYYGIKNISYHNDAQIEKKNRHVQKTFAENRRQ